MEGTKFIEETQTDKYDLGKVEISDGTKIESDFIGYKSSSALSGIKSRGSPYTIQTPNTDSLIDIRDLFVETEVPVFHDVDSNTQIQ